MQLYFITLSNMQNSVKPFSYLFVCISLLCYGAIAYAFPRSDFWYLITCFNVLFGANYYFLKQEQEYSEKEILITAIAFRVLLIASIPSLSDDFYRYLWDGALVLKGINPFAYTPTEAINLGLMEDAVLYQQMNSPDYFSVYPPTNQLVFALSAVGGSYKISLLILKTLAIAADIGTLFLITQISQHFKQGNRPILIYGLNPLVILEFSGNVHSEVFMVFFIALFIALFIKKRNMLSGASLAFAICSKLIPVLILPLLIVKIGWKNGLKLIVTTLAVCTLLFLPLLSAETLNAHKGLSLYFNHFEFYGAIYQIGKLLDGYVVNGFGIGVKLIGLALLAFIYLKRPIVSTQELLQSSLFLFTVYFLFSSTIHPWYIAALVFYGAFTSLNFVLVWTYLTVFTYITYQTETYEQNKWVLWIQFFIVSFFLIKELILENWKKKPSLYNL